jgi:predicted Zn-dependent protease
MGRSSASKPRKRHLPEKDFRWLVKSLLVFYFFLVIFACQTVPITGRQQLSLLPSDQLLSLSITSYSDFLSKHEVVRGTRETHMVSNVGMRIKQAVEDYFYRIKQSHRIAGYTWEFNLIKDPSVNAWAMPGGKVAVYTGIMPIARNENGLAVVMGHEIAHVIAGHGNERMSQGLLAELGGMALSRALAAKPTQTQNLFLTAYGLGAQLGVLLPYSRLQESEADHLGLIFMTMAGYDPREAIGFWQRMAAEKKGGAPPEFLSTHPADQTRMKDLKKLIPEAMEYYQK